MCAGIEGTWGKCNGTRVMGERRESRNYTDIINFKSVVVNCVGAYCACAMGKREAGLVRTSGEERRKRRGSTV